MITRDIRGGSAANEVLTVAHCVDADPERRQVAVLDVSGAMALMSGRRPDIGLLLGP
jgi:uncharacterized Ntn-hydrolase superfamily protein